ncbi:MAG: amino acid permease [Acidobacteriota bacterium]
MCTALVAGNMIGSGIFLLPASLAPFGALSILAWVLTAFGSIALALVFASLGRRLPRAGGPYAYTRAGFGDLAGFLVGWGYWISTLATNAAISVALVSYLTTFWPALSEDRILAAGLALGIIWLLTGVNCLGVRTSGHVQLVSTALKVVPLVLVAIVGLLYFDPENLRPLADHAARPVSATTTAVALTLWAFLGLESATIPAGDVVEPKRTIPRATVLGTSLVAILYVASTVAVMGMMAPERLAASDAPFADAARQIAGGWAGYGIAAGAVISCFGALNGWILVQGQVPMALAQDGLFPAVFGRVGRHGTPAAGMVISSLLVTVLMAMNYTRTLNALFTFVILLATLACLVAYVFSTMAELVLLRGGARGARRRRAAPAVIAVLAFLYSMWAVAGAGVEAVYWGFLLLLAGIPVHVWMRTRQAPRADTSEPGPLASG